MFMHSHNVTCNAEKRFLVLQVHAGKLDSDLGMKSHTSLILEQHVHLIYISICKQCMDALQKQPFCNFSNIIP